MSKESEDEVRLTAELWKPSAVLKVAENRAVQTAKFLHARRVQLKRLSKRASVDDAIALTELIIVLGVCPRIRVRNPQVLASKQLASFEPN